MCKHEFKVYVSDLTVVTFCQKCGEIGDVVPKDFSNPYPVYPIYPDPYNPWYWTTTPGLSGTIDCAGQDWNLGDITTSTLTDGQWSYTTGFDSASSDSETSETLWELNLETGELKRCK